MSNSHKKKRDQSRDVKKSQHPQLRDKTVLVTGATGFIGLHLCRRLSEMECSVYAVSRSRNSHIDSINVEHLPVDLADLDATRNLFNQLNPDLTFHLAGHATGNRSIEVVSTTFKSNLETTVNILTATTESDCGRIVVAGSLEEPSTDQVYSIPVSPYAASKGAAANYVRMFNSLFNTPAVVAQIFMVYGPGPQDPQRLVPYVISSLLSGNPPKLSSGIREIDWIYIDDVVDALLKAGITKDIDGETVQIGSGHRISTSDFVTRIKALSSSDTNLHFGARTDRPQETVRTADITKTYTQIQWKPSTTLDEGLTRTIDWYREQRQLS